MCTCKIHGWEECPDYPLYERYADSQALLDSVATYYPSQYNSLNLDQAQLLGTGADANVFCVGGEAVKFTQNRQHAKVSWKLANSPPGSYKHLVETASVAHLPDLGLWVIREQVLKTLPPARKERLVRHLTAGESHADVDLFVNSVIRDLDSLGVRAWGVDCVSAHNLMVAPSSPTLVAFDFGYTHTHFPEDYPVWS